MYEADLRDLAAPLRLADGDDTSKVAAVVAAEEAGTSTKKGLLARVVGFVDLLARIGEVQASPTSYTLLDRIKSIGAQLAGALTVQGAASVTTTATIASAGNLSGVIDCGTARLALVIMPSGWDAADLTFRESIDGTNFFDKYDSAGVEYTAVVGAGRSVTINLADFIGARYLKIRSGTSGTPVPQNGGTRTFTLVLVP